jgi:hypothetical protein
MKKSIIILLLALAVVAFFGAKVVKQSKHMYLSERICYAPIGAPECSDLMPYIHGISSKGVSRNSKIVFLGSLYTLGTFPVEWELNINSDLGDASSPIETLTYRPWRHSRTSEQFGTYTNKVEVNDSVAIMKVVGGIDSLQSIIKLRRRW